MDDKTHSLLEAEPYVDQVEKKKDQLADCTRIVFAEDQTGFFKPAAIGFDQERAKYLIGLGFQYEAAAGNTSNTSVYEYDEIAGRAREMYMTGSTEIQWGPFSSGDGSLLPAAERTESTQADESEETQAPESYRNWIVISVFAIVAVAAGAVVFRKRKSHSVKFDKTYIHSPP